MTGLQPVVLTGEYPDSGYPAGPQRWYCIVGE